MSAVLTIEHQRLILSSGGNRLSATPLSRLFSLCWAQTAGRWTATSWTELIADDVSVSWSEGRLRLQVDSFGGQEVALTAVARIDGDEVIWSTAVVNRSSGVVVALKGPALRQVATPADAVLVLPNRHGIALEEPWSALHAEVHELAYPVPASLQLMACTGATGGVAVHVLDPSLGHKLLRVGGPERELGVQQHPFLEPGERWDGPPVVWQVLRGTWHEAADRYRSWVESWLPAPVVSEQIRGFPLIGLEVVKSRPEDDLDIPDVLADMESGSYAASLPRVRELAARGMDGVELVGWFGEGHDTTFPDYDATEPLGGPEGMHGLVDEAKASGLLVALYLNLRLANVTSPTYLAHPEWRLFTRDLGPHTERYGDQVFHAMCPAAAGWQEHMTGVVDTCFRVWRVDGVQFDQVGAAESLLCFDPRHGHATPATAWGEGYPHWLKRLRDLARAINPQAWTWIEGSWDAAGAYVDISQDNFWDDLPTSRPLPALYRYTMPSHPVFGDARIGGVPYWCKTDPDRARVTYDAVGRDFLAARFLDEQGVTVEAGVEARLFLGDRYGLVTLAEVAGVERVVDVTVDHPLLPGAAARRAVAVVAGRELSLQAGRSLTFHAVPLPAGEVEVVRFSW